MIAAMNAYLTLVPVLALACPAAPVASGVLAGMCCVLAGMWIARPGRRG